MCSLFIDIQGGMLLLIKKNRPHWLNRPKLSEWINTVSCQWNPNTTRFIFEICPFFLNFPKCKTIGRHSKNTISTSVTCMVNHKLFYAFILEQSLQTWNYGNMTKNLLRNPFCYLIGSISIDKTLQTFGFWSMLSIIYNIIIRTCIYSLIIHSNVFHNGMQTSICAR